MDSDKFRAITGEYQRIAEDGGSTVGRPEGDDGDDIERDDALGGTEETDE